MNSSGSEHFSTGMPKQLVAYNTNKTASIYTLKRENNATLLLQIGVTTPY